MDVAGFISPEVFTTPGQLGRACLEDDTMTKLHGITMAARGQGRRGCAVPGPSGQASIYRGVATSSSRLVARCAGFDRHRRDAALTPAGPLPLLSTATVVTIHLGLLLVRPTGSADTRPPLGDAQQTHRPARAVVVRHLSQAANSRPGRKAAGLTIDTRVVAPSNLTSGIGATRWLGCSGVAPPAAA